MSCLSAPESHSQFNGMDGLICDAELAPQLLKMTNDKLQETRKALEVSTQVCMREASVRWELIRPTGKGCSQGKSRKIAERGDIERLYERRARG